MSDSTTQLTTACQASLSFTISWSLLTLMSIESMMPSKHLILCCPLLLCSQSSPASESFLMSWLFTSGSQSIGASPSASVLPVNIQGWFPLVFTGLTSLLFRGFSRVLWHHNSKHQYFLTSIHGHWKNHGFIVYIVTIWYMCALWKDSHH